MKKHLIIFIVFLLFFLSVVFTPVKADVVEAGASAPLNRDSLVAEKYAQINEEKEIKSVIESVLNKYNSPLAGESDAFVNACFKYRIDCYLLPSIAGLESTFGKYTYPDSNNPFGWGGGLIKFKNTTDSIDTVAKGIKENYYNKGAYTIETIGPIYSESPTWSIRVKKFWSEFHSYDEKILLLSKQIPV